MAHSANTPDVRAIMSEFADQTGLSNPGIPPRRYLWTDAHAVCNFLSLYRHTGDELYRDLALRLIDQVHHILGRHRGDDPRHGWISGLSDEEGEDHPTAGGLRIGKALDERRPDDAYDEQLEWDRDGQYFHYLTKWMHALYKAGKSTRQMRYCRWAIELAKVAHAGFTAASLPGGPQRLVWKMSIDLSYPLVRSSGLHDPLDGFVTYNELGLCQAMVAEDSRLPDLSSETAATAEMNQGQRWATDDSLGIGGLLFDACRLFQLVALGHPEHEGIVAKLLGDVRISLESFMSRNALSHPAEYRLAFRELGLSIGLRAVEKMWRIEESQPDMFGHSLKQDLREVRKYVPLAEEIENFWRKPHIQHVSSWLEHRDINRVMLATSLLPNEFLTI